MYRPLLLWLGFCSPLLFLSLSAFFVLASLGPLAVLVAFRRLALRPAPASYAEPFRNIVIAHRGGQQQRRPDETKNVGASPSPLAATAASTSPLPLPLQQPSASLQQPSASTTATNNTTLLPPDCSAEFQQFFQPVFPENSLAAFRWASSPACGGADGLELDVWLSSDGVPMVNHDPDVFRHFDGQGLVSSMTCSQLQALKYLRTPLYPSHMDSVNHAYEKAEIRQVGGLPEIHEDYLKTERMPTLYEVLDLLEKDAPHMKCMIEVKERVQLAPMAACLARLYTERPWMYERCFVASFNPVFLYKLRQADARIVTSFLFVGEFTRHLARGARELRIPLPWWFENLAPIRWMMDDVWWWLGTNPAGLRFLGCNLSACEVKDLTENQIRRDRAAGILTSTWVVNHAPQKEWLLQQGVTVITDLQFEGGPCSSSPRPQILF